MKKILFILLAILCHLDSFAQLGYWCNWTQKARKSSVISLLPWK